MPSVLPVLSKSWYLVPNVDCGTGGGQLLLDIKQILKGVAYSGRSIASNAWTVVGSSNSAVAAMDAVDRWTASGDVIRNTSSSGARSWIVLRNSATGRQMLIDYVGADKYHCAVFFSYAAGFTGGSTTARPTATDETTMEDNGVSVPFGDILLTKSILNIWQSTDGKQTMLVTNQQGATSTFWMWGNVEDAPASWAYPFISVGYQGDGGASSRCWFYLFVGEAGGEHMNARVNPTKVARVFAISEGINPGSGATTLLSAGGAAMNFANELSGVFDIMDKFWLQSDDVDLWGPLGWWPDLWPTCTTRVGYVSGDHFPADGSRQFVHFNDLVFWWGGAPAAVMS